MPRPHLHLTLILSLGALACARTTPPPASPTARPPPNLSPPAPLSLASQIDPIFSDLTRPGTPGCAVAVYHAGEIAFARGYGLANLELDVPITPQTTFDVGSVSKQFTAMSVLLLAEDGKLSLDDDVRKYVPELPVYGKPITLHHLLHHTSGLREYTGLFVLSGFDEADVTNDDDALHAISHQKALNFPTGTEWSYSNTGYFLLSIVVKRVTGKTLAAFAQERIFDPLGMRSTFILDDHKRLVPRRATAYAPREGGARFGIEMSDFEQTGAVAVQTTVEDLAKWDANFYAPKVGTAATLALMRTPGKLDDGKPVSYAMGLGITKTNGILTEDHNGEWAGYRAELVRYPSERLTVACLCNVANAEPEERAHKVAIALDPRLAPSEPAAAGDKSEGAPRPSPSRATVPADALAAVAGAYLDLESFEIRTIAVDKGSVSLGFQLEPGGDHRDLATDDGRTFTVLGAPAAAAALYRFERAAGKTPAHLVRTPASGKTMTLVRFEPFTPSPAQLADYAGRYTSDEIRGEMHVALVDGKLYPGAWGRTLEKEPLKPIAKDIFVVGTIGLRFERDARGKVRGLTLTAEPIHGLTWKRRDDR